LKLNHLAVFILTFVLIFVGCGSDSTKSANAAGPEWRTYSDGMKLGQSGNKHIMINFYADWCHYCDQMFEETLTDEKVVSFLSENFVSIKVDTEADRDLAMEYYVRGLPTIWFLKSDGEKLAPIPGFVPPEQFLNILKYIAAKAYETMSFKEFMEKGLDKK
jgi:thioredoxin-related protein